jgi:hypothetical protein
VSGIWVDALRAGGLAADTHWSSVGQAALLEPLLDFLRREGLRD